MFVAKLASSTGMFLAVTAFSAGGGRPYPAVAGEKEPAERAEKRPAARAALEEKDRYVRVQPVLGTARSNQWSSLPSEDWLILPRPLCTRLLPSARARTGDSWELDSLSPAGTTALVPRQPFWEWWSSMRPSARSSR